MDKLVSQEALSRARRRRRRGGEGVQILEPKPSSVGLARVCPHVVGDAKWNTEMASPSHASFCKFEF